jgi:hypothetical protein
MDAMMAATMEAMTGATMAATTDTTTDMEGTIRIGGIATTTAATASGSRIHPGRLFRLVRKSGSPATTRADPASRRLPVITGRPVRP